MKSNGGSPMLDLPPQLKGLEFLATDLRFTWSYTADYLWEKLDPDLFALTRNPWLALLSTSGETHYAEFAFAPGDVIMVGRESAGAPEEVHASAQARLRIPVRAGLRSLNVAVAAAMVLGEALRQTGQFPRGDFW